MALSRYKMTIAYDGAAFQGWQEQLPPAGPAPRTVQRVVRDALQHVLGCPITLQGASRTDSGVHAFGQCAHFDADCRIPIERLALAINSRLPDDVEVLDVHTVHPAFDATSDAIEKQYRYRLWIERRRPLQWRRLVYPVLHAELNAAAMRDAAARLVGTHDFAAFAAAGHGRESTIRTIFACDIEPHEPADSLDGRQLHIVVRGGGFLYRMVRILSGTLLEVGRGRFTPDHIDTLLAEKDRSHAGPTLPPEGLCLEWVRYPDAPRAAAQRPATTDADPETP